MQRATLGLAALFLLVMGSVIAVQQPEGGAVFAGACIRVGMVLGALWLALPQITTFWKQTPKWLLIAAGVTLVVGVIHPLYALAAVPLLGLLWFFGPRVLAIWKPKAGPTAAAKPHPADESSATIPQPASQPKRPRRRSNAR